ncbi:hypothetical protein [Paenibacillus sp. yr247]|uniref:hypothetical protein n=1 Tax=Paenibacillus sp. yr247 TaxID=1761880 RepID=UPI001587769E|nr:hypothetical protein [Paenibacillus sp. yr247]
MTIMNEYLKKKVNGKNTSVPAERESYISSSWSLIMVVLNLTENNPFDKVLA